MAHPLEKYDVWYVRYFGDGFYLYRREDFAVDHVETLATKRSFEVQASLFENTHPDNIEILGFEVIEVP